MCGAVGSGSPRRCSSSLHVPYPPLVEYDVGENPLQNELFVEPLRYADGHLAVPRGPGLGVTLDEAAIKRFSQA